MNNIPTAEELFAKYSSLYSFEEGAPEYLVDKEDFITALQEYAKAHVQACKNEIAENAMVLEDYENPQLEHVWESHNTCDNDVTFTVDRDGIMKFYPLTNIQ